MYSFMEDNKVWNPQKRINLKIKLNLGESDFNCVNFVFNDKVNGLSYLIDTEKVKTPEYSI